LKYSTNRDLEQFKVEEVLQKFMKEDIERIDTLLPTAEAIKGANISDKSFETIWYKPRGLWGKEKEMDVKAEIESI
jgi:hypothetical protein